ncbi:hypothetical protein ACFL59_03640 [Planctomycetota bacterium]
MHWRWIMAAFVAALLAPGASGGEIGFEETYALADDRAKALEQLIPGTKDYYYYHCLHRQNTGDLDGVPELVKTWVGRHGRSVRVDEILNRQALLTYDRAPQASLKRIRQQLGVHFNHQRVVAERATQYPTSLDPKVIARKRLTQEARGRYSNLRGFRDSALRWLVTEKLDMQELRDLLNRLDRPDHPKLVELVVRELRDRHSRGFGRLGIHGRMLPEQLIELARLHPQVKTDTDYVNARIRSLWPNPDVSWRHEPRARLAYLERVWAYVSLLEPAFNSLKVHVLYHRLAAERAQGTYHRERFLEYLKLPRRADYVAPDYLKRRDLRNYVANLGARFNDVTLLPAVGRDKALVEDYLQQLLLDAKDAKPFAPYVRDTWLRRVFATAKILAGVGDMERWYSVLDDPGYYQQLKERVEIELGPQNQTVFSARDEVSLTVDLKNVRTLVVKVFELNMLNFYLSHDQEIDTSIDLDGLVASEERTHSYDVPPLRRHRETFTFPRLSQPGVYVVELIGNGRSSRALVRKGSLRALERLGAAGHVFTVLDEDNKVLTDASLWFSGHELQSDEHGEIVVPFSSGPGQRTVLLRHGGLTTRQTFNHRSEEYELRAAFYVEREELTPGEEAKVVVRPHLLLQGNSVSLSLLKDVQLTIRSTDRHGVDATLTKKDLSLGYEGETTASFRVTDELSRLAFTLRGRIEKVTTGGEEWLEDGATFELNGIDTTNHIEDLHLAKTNRGYVLYLLGKTGEIKAGKPVNLTLRHRDFRDPARTTVQTDAKGRVELGALKDIDRFEAASPMGVTQTFRPSRDLATVPQSLHGTTGDALRLPYVGAAGKPERWAFSLLEKRGRTFVADRFDSLRLEGGYLTIAGLPRGNFSLKLRERGRVVDLRVAEGKKVRGYAASDHRLLEASGTAPLQIVSAAASDAGLKVELANAGEGTRVHVAATRFAPIHSLLGLTDPNTLGLVSMVTEPWRSAYVSGRDIGDEYRYILERRYAAKYPGNMLSRPGLLLNPWAIRDTDTGRLGAGAGGQYGGRAGKARLLREGGSAGTEAAALLTLQPHANLDFLPRQGLLLTNLRPDKQGVVKVAREKLKGYALVRVVAVDEEGAVVREVALPEATDPVRDLRLRKGLDSAKDLAQTRNVTVLQKGGSVLIEDRTTSQVEVYDSLARVYGLFMTLSGDQHLREFDFVLRWPDLKDAEKRSLYSRYACHELSFFLSRKDLEFFRSVVQPYLRNKKDKTFMDDYLLGGDLSGYLEPWAYGRLNIVERILLGRRFKGEFGAMRRHVSDLLDLLSPDVERRNHLFDTALRGRALEQTAAAGWGKADTDDGEMFMEESADGEAAATEEREAPAEAESAPPAPSAPGAPMADMDKAAELGLEMKGKKSRRPARARDELLRKEQRQLYRKPDKTKEWVESYYYRRPLAEQNASLITVNAFWADFAAHGGARPFMSQHVAEASRSFAEMLLALSVLDLPMKPAGQTTERDGVRVTIGAKSPSILFHQEIRPIGSADTGTPVLLSQNYFRADDRYRFEGHERFDKYVTGELIVHTVYVCQVVLTNPTSSRQRLEVLVQIPRGAMPVQNGFRTRSVHVQLEPYHTQALEYAFYFPRPGKFTHYPAHASQRERLVAEATAPVLNVVERPSEVDKSSWAWISQNGSAAEVLNYLREHNLDRLDLDKIAWRMRDKAFFAKALDLLHRRHVYANTLWSYGLHANAKSRIAEYLRHQDHFLRRCGPALESSLLTIEPIERRWFEHREYDPYVNARAHRLGARRQIVNERVAQQYRELMSIIAHRPGVGDRDWLATAYYLFLQDRVEEGLAAYGRVDAKRIAERLQYDYLSCFAAFYREDPAGAGKIAERYAEYPVERWRKRFAGVLAQVREVAGKGDAEVVDQKDRQERQTQLAATQGAFEFKVEDRTITLNYQNLDTCMVNYYLMDIELLFSRQPFVQEGADRFAMIRPNRSETLTLQKERKVFSFDLPQEYQGANVVVEVVAQGVRKAQAYYAHRLLPQVIASYGQVKVTHRDTGKPVAKAYVKVFARQHGQVAFYKDGYTDLRGRFDYASLSTNDLDDVERFAILILSEDAGAVIREAAPPAR